MPHNSAMTISIGQQQQQQFNSVLLQRCGRGKNEQNCKSTRLQRNLRVAARKGRLRSQYAWGQGGPNVVLDGRVEIVSQQSVAPARQYRQKTPACLVREIRWMSVKVSHQYRWTSHAQAQAFAKTHPTVGLQRSFVFRTPHMCGAQIIIRNMPSKTLVLEIRPAFPGLVPLKLICQHTELFFKWYDTRWVLP